MRRGTRRTRLGLCLALAAACGSGAELRAQGMSSANNNLYPGSYDAAGLNTSSSTNNRLTGAAGQGVDRATSTSAGYVLGAGLLHILSYPGTVTTLTSLAASVWTSSVTLQWTAPGQDGALGTLPSATTYYVRVASFTVPNVNFSNANIFISTKGPSPGVAVSSNVFSLLPNTTYFAQLWTADWAGNIGFGSPVSTFSTLAKAPSSAAITFVNVYTSSATVQWTGLPNPPPSSGTCEGYELDASTTNFGALGAGGYLASSQTFSANQATLTVSGLDLTATNYFRVGSFNWSGALNYVALPRFNLQIATSATTLSFGSIDPTVYMSTVSQSSITVTNVGTVNVTLLLSASTATTPSSPWTLSVSSGDEMPVLQGLWNSSLPASNSFNLAITTTPVASGPALGNYAGNQHADIVAPGSSTTLWFKFWLPTSTVSNVKELIHVVVKGQYHQ